MIGSGRGERAGKQADSKAKTYGIARRLDHPDKENNWEVFIYTVAGKGKGRRNYFILDTTEERPAGSDLAPKCALTDGIIALLSPEHLTPLLKRGQEHRLPDGQGCARPREVAPNKANESRKRLQFEQKQKPVKHTDRTKGTSGKGESGPQGVQQASPCD
ncbi:unnamed protein product [Bursaphelenchus xylophilus]|uniref:(pine wood nematode) hypothetical protein n=1 Tax=Bursaphelenchus xylophilus TaxID=6326 RepID=A0A7I8X6G6_BURXY|nr:unnamed protein product [Bursaphelenchus xylophilus]CAG9122951.1 unnamed protein product [Bursaphelenchus xylophilus]